MTEKGAAKILASPGHERFFEIAALLLSRTNNLKLVFSGYFEKKIFCRYWRQIKARMRKNKWADERIDFWDQVHKTLYGQMGKQIAREKKREAFRPSYLKQFADVLHRERKKRRMTQKELARKAGLSRQTISYVESGRHDFSIMTLKKISGVLNLEVKILPF